MPALRLTILLSLLASGLMARESTPKLLDASSSSDPDGSIVRFEWDLDGNGTFEVDGGPSPTLTHTFERFKGLVDPRVRPIAVRVTDDDGATAVDASSCACTSPPAGTSSSTAGWSSPVRASARATRQPTSAR